MENKKLNKKVIITIIAAVIAVIAGVVCAVVFSQKKTTTEQETTVETTKELETEKETETEKEVFESVLPDKISEDYDADIQAILEKVTTKVADTKIDEVVAKTTENDFTFETTESILGTPHFILDTYNGEDFYVYDETLITKKLDSLLKDTNYTEDSFVKVGWITESDTVISTYIPLDLTTKLQVTGFLVEDKDNADIFQSENLKTTTVGINEIESIDISLESLQEKLGAELYMYKVQYPMSYESEFIQSRMDEESSSLTSKNYCIKVVKDEVTIGYLMVETFEDVITDIYEVYEDNSGFAVVDDATADKIKNSNGMTKEDFMELVPGAVKVEIMRSSFDNTISAIEYYGFIRESDKTEGTITTIQIVNDKVISEVVETESETTETESETETTLESETETISETTTE